MYSGKLLGEKCLQRTVITFLDLCLYKEKRFAKEGILDIKTHIKSTNTQQYVHHSSAHPPETGGGIIKENRY